MLGMMVLMTFKKQGRAKPCDAIALALHYLVGRIILKSLRNTAYGLREAG